jgi:CRP/FNR family transcriptional regulator, cyclic AMP receptor protein
MANPVQSPADPLALAEYRVQFAPGEVVFSEGEPATTAYLLGEGRVRLVKRIGAVERGLRVVRAGEVFGHTALMQGALRSATAISLADCSALAFSRKDLVSLLTRHPDIGVKLCEQLVLRAKRAEDRIEIAMVRDAQSRVVLGILRSAQTSSLEHTDATGAVRLPVTPLELSAMLGLDVNAVKRAVQRLRDNEYVRIVDEQVEIPDVEALNELHGLLQARAEIVGGDD